MSESSLVALKVACAQCATQYKRAGYRLTMKMHVSKDHVPNQARFAGNPRWSHNYEDESANFGTKSIGDGCNRVNFSRNYLARWFFAYEHGAFH